MPVRAARALLRSEAARPRPRGGAGALHSLQTLAGTLARVAAGALAQRARGRGAGAGARGPSAVLRE